MNENPGALLPELLLLARAVVGLVTGLFTPRGRQWTVAVVAAVALTAALADLARGPQRVFDGTYAVDIGLGVARVVIAVGVLLVLGCRWRPCVATVARPSTMSCCCSPHSGRRSWQARPM